LKGWLRHAGLHYPLDDLPAVLTAYKKIMATSQRYPNSLEVLRTLLGPERLRGVVCEFDRGKAEVLRERLRAQEWKGSALELHEGSWRTLGPVPLVNGPWLVSMDPMTYMAEEDGPDDDRIRRADLRRVLDLVAPLDRGGPGALAIFCYSMDAARRDAFVDTVSEIIVPSVSDGNLRCLETTARGGNRHVGALISQDTSILDGVTAAWEALARGAS